MEDRRSCLPNLKQLRKELWVERGFEPVTLRYRCNALTNLLQVSDQANW